VAKAKEMSFSEARVEVASSSWIKVVFAGALDVSGEWPWEHPNMTGAAVRYTIHW
jgi:hypothetical protein